MEVIEGQPDECVEVRGRISSGSNRCVKTEPLPGAIYASIILMDAAEK